MLHLEMVSGIASGDRINLSEDIRDVMEEGMDSKRKTEILANLCPVLT